MSYIPKYILKRLVPKDAVTLEGDEISVEVTNVISPIPIGDLPGSLKDVLYIDLDGETVFSPEKQEIADDVKLFWDGEEYDLETIKQAGGGTMAVGGKLKVKIPNKWDLSVGETHKLKLKVDIDSPIEIEFEREISE